MGRSFATGLRRLDRKLTSRVDAAILEPEMPAAVCRLLLQTHARIRHELTVRAIRRAPWRTSSTWKVVLATMLERGDVVIDAGANVGRVAQAAAWVVGKSGRVHCFEPSPSVATLLQRRLDRLRIENVVVNVSALGDHAGAAVLYEYEDGLGGSSSLRARSWPGHDHDLESRVDVCTLDDYVDRERLGLVHFIKVDVEGSEIDVLQGATRTIEANLPIMLIEASRVTTAAFGRSLDDLIRLVRGLGYELYSWRPPRLVSVRGEQDVPQDWHHDDLLCVHPSGNRRLPEWPLC